MVQVLSVVNRNGLLNRRESYMGSIPIWISNFEGMSMHRFEPKYPDIVVKLTGEDGNIFNLIGITLSRMKEAGVSDDELHAFKQEILNTDSYSKAIWVIMTWVTVT